MKYLLASVVLAIIASPAFAADDSYQAPVWPDQQYSYGEQNPWSRPYVGIFGGVAAGDFKYSTNALGVDSELSLSGGGLAGGLRVGYDYATNSFLVGAVADVAITSIKTSGAFSSGGLSGDLEARVSALGTIRGRVGVTQKNNLYYLHGGAAFGRVDISDTGTAVPGIIDNTRVGFTLGAGYEYAISSNASFQTEYSYTDLGSYDIYSVGPVKVSEHVSFHKIASGFNIRF